MLRVVVEVVPRELLLPRGRAAREASVLAAATRTGGLLQKRKSNEEAGKRGGEAA